MLELEQARHWRAREDRRVLFVCFNRRLAQHLRALEKDARSALVQARHARNVVGRPDAVPGRPSGPIAAPLR